MRTDENSSSTTAQQQSANPYHPSVRETGKERMKSIKFTGAAIPLILGILLQAQAQDPFTNGLVAYYPFNGNANDESGDGRNGVVNGATLIADRHGVTNAAYWFNGSSDYIYTSPTFPITGNSPRSISFWFNPNGIRASQLVYWGNVSSSGALSGVTIDTPNSAGAQDFIFHGAYRDAFSQRLQLATNTWHHLVVVYATNVQSTLFYLDGRQVATDMGSTSTQTLNTPANTPLGIGRNMSRDIDTNQPWQTPFRGGIDDVRIYNRELSRSEVQTLYSIEKSPFPHLTIVVKTVRVDMYVEIGKTYQLQSSSDLNTWSPVGIPFVATAKTYWNDFDVLDGQQFFRIIEVLP
jgi:hypothetical protein